jgi:hypothetical protein
MAVKTGDSVLLMNAPPPLGNGGTEATLLPRMALNADRLLGKDCAGAGEDAD